ncbi:hypothetical protein [Novosphingobium sp. Gsoil 351]|uniref:hypothetical protein n=1 Tax=Novosphingobium sp. Gsoil 351 TaxID=2675225 RepID=UPI001E2C2A8B|nr:hypothetical protein [Novosphingobium sp. Gsoil 351]
MRPSDENEIISRASTAPRLGEQCAIGPGGTLPAARGFTVSRIGLRLAESTPALEQQSPEVVFVQSGYAEVRTPEGNVSLAAGDTMTVPIGLLRAYAASASDAQLIVVRGEPS